MDEQQNSANLDPRHQRRMETMQLLFAYSFYNQENSQNFRQDLMDRIKPIVAKFDELDQLIAQFAPERPLTEINQVDLAILRLIVFESKYTDTPSKVLVNEAIELAKEFGGENSPKFINGALAKLLADSFGNQKEENTKE